MIPGGQPNMQQLLQQAQKMQQDLAAAQQELAETPVEGSAGGGLVKATVTGSGELQGLVIDPKAVDPEAGSAEENAETIADLVLAAVRDANASAAAASAAEARPARPGSGRRCWDPRSPLLRSSQRSVRSTAEEREDVPCMKAWFRT